MKHEVKLYIVSVGPGSSEFLTSASERILKSADCLVVAERHLPLTDGHGNVVLIDRKSVV